MEMRTMSEEKDWTEEPEVEEVQDSIEDWNALNAKAFYNNDHSKNRSQFKAYCEDFINDIEKELEKFKHKVESL
jgi:hypothetical protein